MDFSRWPGWIDAPCIWWPGWVLAGDQDGLMHLVFGDQGGFKQVTRIDLSRWPGQVEAHCVWWQDVFKQMARMDNRTRYLVNRMDRRTLYLVTGIDLSRWPGWIQAADCDVFGYHGYTMFGYHNRFKHTVFSYYDGFKHTVFGYQDGFKHWLPGWI